MLSASFYETYLSPYLKSAGQSVAIDLAVKGMLARGMTVEEANKAAYELVTGQPYPTYQPGFFDKSVFGIKMPYLVAGSVGTLLLYFLVKRR